MEPTELQNLIARAQKHEQSAFGELYDMYAQRIYRFISFKVATREQAEDILQETFLKAWQALPKLRLEKLYFSAWLYTIARNLVNDHYRTLKRRPTPDDIENFYDLADSDDPLDNVASRLEEEKLRSCLNDLPSDYRQVLDLRFLQEFTVEETANIMRKTAIAVRVMQHRAIKKLNILFEPQTDE